MTPYSCAQVSARAFTIIIELLGAPPTDEHPSLSWPRSEHAWIKLTTLTCPTVWFNTLVASLTVSISSSPEFDHVAVEPDFTRAIQHCTSPGLHVLLLTVLK